MAEKTVIEFDLDRYLRASKKLDISGIDWDEIPKHPLSDGDVMCMHYMMDIETHTVIYLRDLLATRAANDPQITAFLSCWVYEELWHGEAFSDFLRAYGIEVPAEPKLPDGSTPMPTRTKRTRRFREQLGVGHQLSLLPTMMGSMVFRDFIGLHMTWGAINELTTLTGYQRLKAVAAHPVLSELLETIMRDESRHFFFYYRQAEMRLQRPRVAPVTRLLVNRFWAPVGSGVGSDADLKFMAHYLFAGTEGRVAARKVDDTLRKLPGFADAQLLEAWMNRYVGPHRVNGGSNGHSRH